MVKRLLMFILIAVLLIGTTVPGQANAATVYNQQDSYMTFLQAIKAMGFDTSKFTNSEYLNNVNACKYFAIYYSEYYKTYIVWYSNTKPVKLKREYDGYFVSSSGSNIKAEKWKFTKNGWSTGGWSNTHADIYLGTKSATIYYTNFPFEFENLSTATTNISLVSAPAPTATPTPTPRPTSTPTPRPTNTPTPTPTNTPTPTPTSTPTPTPTNMPTPTPTPTPSVSLKVKDNIAKAEYSVFGGIKFYLELLESGTSDGTFTKYAVSPTITGTGNGNYTFKKALQSGSYYKIRLLLLDGTLLAQSDTSYIVKDDAEVALDISVTTDGIVSGTYALAGGQAISAKIYLQESASGFSYDNWITVDMAKSVTGEGNLFTYQAKDYYHYRLCCDYVCINDDGVDVSGIRYSGQVQHTLPPDPELLNNSQDFFAFFKDVIKIMQMFPLNLFVVSILVCAAIIFFDAAMHGKNKNKGRKK